MNAEKIRVLVLDDEPIVADSLAQILNLYGYQAVAVYDARDAIEWVATQPCEFLISDVVLGSGSMSGIDVAIQWGMLLPQSRVLLISGNNSTAELLKSAEQLGHTFDVLPKPVHPSVILERLKISLRTD